jgi:hypothetical protein
MVFLSPPRQIRGCIMAPLHPSTFFPIRQSPCIRHRSGQTLATPRHSGLRPADNSRDSVDVIANMPIRQPVISAFHQLELSTDI